MNHLVKQQVNDAAIILLIIFFSILIPLIIISLSLNIDLKILFSRYFYSTIGTRDGLTAILVRFTPLLVTALALTVAFKSSVWNIGAEGQIIFGAIATLGICLHLNLHPIILILLSFIFAFFLGGMWGLIAGSLKALWNVNEIPVTLMLNFVAYELIRYLISSPWKSPEGLYPATIRIPFETRLPFIESPVNSSIIIAIALIPVIYLLINKTSLGFELRAVGFNRDIAHYQGINTKKTIMTCMIISGGLAALAGVLIVLGDVFRGEEGITGSYGFLAIVVVLISRNRAELIPLAAFLVASIIVGAIGLIVVGVPRRFTEILTGILFIAAITPKLLEKLK